MQEFRAVPLVPYLVLKVVMNPLEASATAWHARSNASNTMVERSLLVFILILSFKKTAGTFFRDRFFDIDEGFQGPSHVIEAAAIVPPSHSGRAPPISHPGQHGYLQSLPSELTKS
jgi:hypothetical protein